MQNSGARGHPLCVAICNSATTTVVIFVVKNSVNDVGNCFKAAMWVPRGSLWFTRCIFDFTHLIKVNEGIKVCHINASKRSADWETLTFETLRSCRNAFNSTNFANRIGCDARQDGDIANCYCWHGAGSFLLN